MIPEHAAMRIHPLFDRSSLYRLAVEESAFLIDNGEQSVYDFFQSRRRKDLHRDWLLAEERPSVAQDWGLGPALNESIHQHLLRSTQSNKQIYEPVDAANADEASPALLVYRFDLDELTNPYPIILRNPRLFSGCGQGISTRQLDEFVIDIDSESGQKFPNGHIALFLIATPSLVKMLDEIKSESSGEKPNDNPDAIATISWALGSEVLTNRLPRRRASRVSLQLANSPAIQGVIHNGAFRSEINLGAKCPGLDIDTFGVFCVGPEI